MNMPENNPADLFPGNNPVMNGTSLGENLVMGLETLMERQETNGRSSDENSVTAKEILEGLGFAGDKAQKQALEKIRRRQRPLIKAAIAKLGLEMPLEVAEANSAILLEAVSQQEACQGCQHAPAKAMTCYHTKVRYHADSRRLDRCVVPCPFAAGYKKEYARQQDKEENMLLRRRFSERTFANFTPTEQSRKILDFCQSWVASYRPHTKGLYLYGRVGCGKTHLAVACMQALKECYHESCVFLVVPEFCDLLKSKFGSGEELQKEFNFFAKAPVLVIDDLGEGRKEANGSLSGWAKEKIFTLINYRYENQLTTIVTSILDPFALGEVIGLPARSRLGEMCQFLHIKDTDHRMLGFHVIE